MKKHIIVPIVLMMMLTLFSATVAAEDTYDYTLLIYMNGSDLETDYGLATDDLVEMIGSELGENVAVVIETGGTKDWTPSNALLPVINARLNQRWLMTDDELVLLETNDRANMGESDSLRDFLDFGISNFASDQYALIMWDHGNGSIMGFGADEHYNYDSLTLPEMQEAFRKNKLKHDIKFDLVSFDACLMNSLEVAHILSPFADYLLGSEELVPGHGWSYGPMLDYLSSEVNPDPVTLSKVILDSFIEQAQSLDTYYDITTSLIDLSKTETMMLAADQLFTVLDMGIDSDVTAQKIIRGRINAESYGEAGIASGDQGSDSDMVDMGDFSEKVFDLYPVEAQAMLDAIDQAVIYNHSGPFNAEATGVSIYLPAKNNDLILVAPELMDAIEMPASYVRFIKKLYNRLDVGEPIDFEPTEVSFSEGSLTGDDAYFYYEVNPNNYDYIYHISTYMGKVDVEENIQYLAFDDLPEDGILTDGTLIGTTLDDWVTIDGIAIAMYYEKGNSDGSTNYFIPVLLNGEEADLMVIFNNQNPNGKIIGTRILSNSNNPGFSRSLTALKSTDVVEFIYEYDTYDAYSDGYSYDGWYTLSEQVTVGNGLTLNWTSISSGTYAYAFEIEDIYGDLHYSPWVFYDYLETDVASDDMEVEDYPWLKSNMEMPSEWAMTYVNAAFNNGLTTESTLMNFKENITREAFCELAVKLYETASGYSVPMPSGSVFTDTDNLTVTKAYDLGIVSGYGEGLFGPEDRITREQLVTMFYRTMTLLDDRYSESIYPVVAFGDQGEISAYAIRATEALVYFDIIDGVGDNRFAPKDKATIEQSLKLVNGVYEYYLEDQNKSWR